MAVFGLDETKNLIDLDSYIDSKISQSDDDYKYSDIGINPDGGFKTEITITQDYPIWFVAKFEGYTSSDGLTFINNSGVDILLMFESIQRGNSGTNRDIFSMLNDQRSVRDNIDVGVNNEYVTVNRKGFLAVRNGEQIEINNNVEFGYNVLGTSTNYTKGIVYSRPLFVS